MSFCMSFCILTLHNWGQELLCATLLCSTLLYCGAVSSTTVHYWPCFDFALLYYSLHYTAVNILNMYISVSTGWMSWFGNSLVMFVLYRQRSSLQPTDFLTLSLAVSDASISVFGYSRGILEIFNLFKDNGYLITWIWTCQVQLTPKQYIWC